MTTGVLGRRIRILRRYRYLYLMAVPVLLFYALFHYSPMYGLIIAFKDYNVFKGILGSPWAGLYNFELVFGDDYFWKVVRNTAIISLLKLGFGFPAPIIIALLLNEVLYMGFKRVIQTIIYLPRFISWVILAGIMINILSIHGGLVKRNRGAVRRHAAVVPVEAGLLPPHRHRIAHLEDGRLGLHHLPGGAGGDQRRAVRVRGDRRRRQAAADLARHPARHPAGGRAVLSSVPPIGCSLP